MAGADTGAVVAVEVLVEGDQVVPGWVALEQFVAAEDRARPVGALEEARDEGWGAWRGAWRDAGATASAVGRSAALAITSPVERISGPSTGSLPGKRAKGSTAAFTLHCFGGPSSRRPRSAMRAPSASRHADATSSTPVALLTNGTVRDARGFASRT